MAFNLAYLSNNMAVAISPQSEFFTLANFSGTIPPRTIGSLAGTFRSLELPFGTYAANVSANHNGPGSNPAALTARLNVVNAPSVVTMTAPAQNSSILEGDYILLAASATDPDTIVSKVEFYDGSTKIGEAAS